MRKSERAAVELVFCTMIWGFGFIATRWALESFDSAFLTGFRFFAASLCLVPFALSGSAARKKMSWSGFFLAMVPGLFLSVSLWTQTIGLKYTTIANSGFITVMYVVFVPALEAFVFGRRARLVHVLGVVLALSGAALMCGIRSSSGVNIGDLLTLACAFSAAVQIVLLEKISAKIRSPFLYNLYQSFWVGIGPLLMALAVGPKEAARSLAHASPLAWVGMLFLVFGSTMVGFLIQVRAQKTLPASTASMLFLLESPFAALFGYFFFGEKLAAGQWVGAALILVAATVTVRFSAGKI